MRLVAAHPRTRLKDRVLPNYTLGEELCNSISHGLGVAMGVVILVLCVLRSVEHRDVWGIVGSSIYGASMILLYTMSSVYHGLRPCLGKKVMQVIDHCTIYFLIGGTYTPIVLAGLRRYNPVTAWVLFGVVWSLAIVATVFTAIDLKKYKRLSMLCYLGTGWAVMFAIKEVLIVLGPGFYWILGGGIAYTIGAILYAAGKKHRYMHSLFHVFVLAGSLLQFFGIYEYIL